MLLNYLLRVHGDPSILLGSRDMKATESPRKLKISNKIGRRKKIKYSLTNFIIKASKNFYVDI